MNRTQPSTITMSTWDITVTTAYEANRTGLTAAASRIVGQDHAADVVQDAFVRVWSNPDAFDEARGTLTKYLFMVVRSAAIDRVRAIASQRARDLKDISRTVMTTDEPAFGLWAHERCDRVREAMTKLHACQREAILAAYFGHLTYREVAAVLGIPEGTVKSRIRLGLIKLRAELARTEVLAA